MAQKLRDDKIGTLQHSAGNIQMLASASSPAYLTIGGQQYKITSTLIVTLPSMSANTRYQVFAVQSGGVVSLVISQNENSVGPAGYTRWKLVGSLYSNGLGSPAFGSFVNIEGVPSTNIVDYTPTGGFTTNTTYVGKWQRDGKYIRATVDITFSGAPNAASSNFSMPANLLMELTGMANGGNGDRQVIGMANFFDNGVANYWAIVGISSSSIFLIGAVNASATYGVNANGTEVLPMTIGNADSISANVEVPVAGWTNTPIKDL